MVKKYQVARLLDYNREYQTDVLLNSSGYLFNIMGFAIVSSETFKEIFVKKVLRNLMPECLVVELYLKVY